MPVGKFAAWKQAGFDNWKRQVLMHWPALEYLLASLQDLDALTFASYGDVVLSRWHDGGLICIGGAAHGMSPQLV